jgi:hypothetical protein
VTRRIIYGCCYCGHEIAEDAISVRVVLMDRDDDDVWQQWFAHASCALRAMVEDARSGAREEWEGLVE